MEHAASWLTKQAPQPPALVACGLSFTNEPALLPVVGIHMAGTPNMDDSQLA
jgi:hypothetical protein